MAALTIKRIVDVLRKVPEKKFRITELAPRLLDADGKVDIVKAMDEQGELNLAIAEVQFYVHATKTTLKALHHLDGKKLDAVDDLDIDAEPDEFGGDDE